MMARPWANAIATIPARPTPSPTTAAVPAPMKTNAKVPMNSARSFGAIRFDIVDSEDETDAPRDQVVPRGDALAGKGRRHASAPPAGEASGLLRGDRPRLFEPEGRSHASPVCGIRARAIVDVPLFDMQPG